MQQQDDLRCARGPQGRQVYAYCIAAAMFPDLQTDLLAAAGRRDECERRDCSVPGHGPLVQRRRRLERGALGVRHGLSLSS